MNQKLTKLKFLRLLLLFAMTITSVNLYAQGGIKGVVVGSDGEPIFGATVTIDGTTMGTTTNLDGEFSFNVKDGLPITISYIGYKDVQTTLTNGMKVTLEDDATAIEELVVIGYGTAKKETLTGSIAVIGDELLKDKGSTTNPLANLQGQVPGVFVTRSSSAPGSESWSVNLRGSTSLNSSSPLVVIDGFASSTSSSQLGNLNPNDIESMSFLKDGAAAIYGSSAAAGVILITTKKGAEGKISVEYSATATYKYLGNAPSLMNASQWSEAMIEAIYSAAETTGSSVNETWLTYYQLMQEYPGAILTQSSSSYPFDWYALEDFPLFDDVSYYDSLWGSTWSTEHNVSVSGGNERATYRASLGYLYDGSALQYGNNSNQRYNLRLSNTFKITDDFTWTSNISYDKQLQVAPTDLASALTGSIPQPGLPLVNANGDPYSWGGWKSPVGVLEEGGDNNLIVDKITINQSLNYQLTDWLSATATGSYSTNIANRSTVYSSVDYYSYLGDVLVVTYPTETNTYYQMTTAVTDYYSTSLYLNGNKTYNEVHDFGFTLGGQYDFNEYVYYGIKATEIQDALDIVNGSGTVTIAAQNHYQVATASTFGRLNYGYDGRYLLELNARYDGSSKFQAENRWDVFGGGSFAWRISEEQFVKDVDWVSNLKLRLSYAEMGTQAGIGNYDGVQLYSLNQGSGAYVGGDTDYLTYIKTSGTFASTTRQWERVKTTNIGIDFGFLDNKFSGTFDVYKKNNDNMLISIDLPSTLGDSAPKSNAGKFEAQGWEAMLTYRNKIGSDFNYSVTATISYQENELVEYEGTSVLSSGYTSTQVGYGLNSLFGYNYLGKFETDADAAAYVEKYYDNNDCNMPTVLRAGDNIFEDVNGDGQIDSDDIVYLGSDTAPYSFSLSLAAEYKGIDLNVVFQGSQGRVIYNSIGQYTVPTRSLYMGSTTASIGNTWSLDDKDAYYSPYTTDGNINNYNYQQSSLTAQNATYLRLKNLSIGYTLPAYLLTDKAISKVRFYVAGTDLWEVSGMEEGWDPESQYDATTTERYPFMRSISAGVTLTF